MDINESLRRDDLKNLVKKVFDIDAYQSKIGDDEDVIVISFTVDHEDPAKDLENFIEMGYDFVLDADTSPGETDDGTYKVFVEIERSRHAPQQILTLLDGIERLTGIPDMRFRYFKNFKSQEATEETLAAAVPMDKESYNIATNSSMMENFSTFFSNSYVDEMQVVEESISFKRAYSDKLTYEIVTSGPKAEVYNSIKGPMMLESKDVGEILFLSKYIGNYNITKISDTFIFENKGWAVALRKGK
jgi:hypothetical protein